MDQPAHNLYAEAAIELGFIGMVIFVVLIISIVGGFRECKRAYANQEAGSFLSRNVDAMQVWILLNIVFSFASYGVTSYEWYLLGGLAVAMQRFAAGASTVSNDTTDRSSELRSPRVPGLLTKTQRGQTL
jgi:O-antigen ligase